MTPEDHENERMLLEAILVGITILSLFFIIMKAYWNVQNGYTS